MRAEIFFLFPSTLFGTMEMAWVHGDATQKPFVEWKKRSKAELSSCLISWEA